MGPTSKCGCGRFLKKIFDLNMSEEKLKLLFFTFAIYAPLVIISTNRTMSRLHEYKVITKAIVKGSNPEEAMNKFMENVEGIDFKVYDLGNNEVVRFNSNRGKLSLVSKKKRSKHHSIQQQHTKPQPITTSTPTKKPKKPKDPDAPKRPKNGYQLFVTCATPRVRGETPDSKTHMMEVLTKVAEMWRNMGEEEKSKWQKKAEEEKKKYEKEMEQYKRFKRYEEEHNSI